MDFDALRAAVVPGTAVVGRWPGIVCVAECADRQVLRRLLDVCASSAGVEPGRALARRLAMWLGGSDNPGDGLRFGTVAVTGGEARAGGSRGEQWAVFLYGPVGLVVPDRQVALSGAQSVAWTDRLLPRPDAPVVLALEGGPIPPGVVDGVHDLRMGIVPGAGAVLLPGGEQTGRDTADERGRAEEPRWPVPGPDRPWGTDVTVSTPADGLHPGDAPGNGLPHRGGPGPADGGLRGHDAGAAAERPGGRPHLRPVPSGTNGVAHRAWAPRRGSAVEPDRYPEAEQDRDAGPAGSATSAGASDLMDHLTDDPVELLDDRRPAERDERHGPGTPAGPGEDHDPDRGHSGVNGARVNGVVHDLLGGPDDALPPEPERSPWSDARDAGRPDRIEGWFATPDDSGTESGLRAIGPAEGRRRRHRRSDEELSERAPAAEDGRAGAPGRVNGRRAPGADLPNALEGPRPADGLPAAADGAVEQYADGDPLGTDSLSGDSLRGDDFRSDALRSDDLRGADLRSADSRGADSRGAQPRDAGGEPGAGSVEQTRVAPVAEPSRSPADGEGHHGSTDGSTDGTPRLGVPTQEAVEPEAPHPLAPGGDGGAHGDREAPPATAVRSEQILGVPPGESERPALDEGPITRGLAVDAHEDGSEVRGYLCPRGHLNDPRAHYCTLCGTRIEEQADPPAPGPRPPLGLLVFDDGATYTVDAEYLMGRMPEADPRVASGSLRSLALEDTSGAVSRVHAQIVVNGWDAMLVDAGSRNGTFVSPPGEQGWTQLPTGETHRLVPGTRVRIGGRSFLFESPSGAR